MKCISKQELETVIAQIVTLQSFTSEEIQKALKGAGIALIQRKEALAFLKKRKLVQQHGRHKMTSEVETLRQILKSEDRLQNLYVEMTGKGEKKQLLRKLFNVRQEVVVLYENKAQKAIIYKVEAPIDIDEQANSYKLQDCTTEKYSVIIQGLQEPIEGLDNTQVFSSIDELIETVRKQFNSKD